MRLFAKLKKLIAVILIAVSAVLMTSCGGKDRLNIGFFPNITHSQALYAFDEASLEGIFGDRINVNWFMFNAGPAEAEALRAGSIDIGYIGPIPAITAYASSNGNVRIIGGVSCGGSMLITAGGVEISDVRELSGLTVAVPQFGNTQDIILRMLLAEAGLSSSENGGTVEIIQQPNANIKALLENGQIDAALVPEPWGSQLVSEVGARVLLDHDDIFDGEYPVAVIVVRNDYLTENRETVKAFLKEHLRITDIINGDSLNALKKANTAIKRFTGVAVSDEVIEAACGRIAFNTAVSEKAITSFIELCREQGLIKEYIAYDELVDLSLLEEIIAEQSVLDINS